MGLLLVLVAALLAPAAPAEAAPERSAELRMLELINHERTSRGLPRLTEKYDIRDVAYSWSAHMARVGELFHNPDYTDQICCWRRIAENIAYSGGRTDPEAAAEYLHRRLMNSEDHRRHILTREFREIGVGIWFDGSSMYVTQNFRAPDGTTPPSGSTPPSTSPELDDINVRGLSHACGGAPRSRFPDVSSTFYAADAIDCVVWWDVAGGYRDGYYRPHSSVTRAQMATFIANMIEETDGTLPAPRNRFVDVSGTHEDAIERLAAAGVVSGCATHRFCPDEHVTRGQMATFLANAWRQRTGSSLLLPSSKTFFVDHDGVHEDNIDRIAEAGLAAGTSLGYYEPGRLVTRGQMALFVARTLDLAVARVDGVQPPS